jgi:hypothetical protein
MSQELSRLGSGRIEKHNIYPYRMSSALFALRELEKELSGPRVKRLIIDLSCLTKLHVVAVACWLFESEPFRNVEIILCASKVDFEASLPDPEDFQHVIFAPIGPFREEEIDAEWSSTLDVLTLPGEEGRRLRVGLSPIEVRHGLALLLNDSSSGYHDVHTAQMLQDMKDGKIGSWQLAELRYEDYSDISSAVSAFVTAEGPNRVALIPLGRRLALAQAVLTSLQSVQGTKKSIWLSYPVPTVYEFLAVHAPIVAQLSSARVVA